MTKENNNQEVKKPFYKKIPGFRSGTRWKMIVASIVYFFIFLAIVVPGEDEGASVGADEPPAAAGQEEEPVTRDPDPQLEPEPEKTPEEIYEEEYEEWLNGQFSAWDGAHHDLVKLVKNNMNDAKSFEHVETRYLRIQTQKHIDTVGNGAEIDDVYLYMKFRGANAFGGKVLTEVEALVDKGAGTIKIISDSF